MRNVSHKLMIDGLVTLAHHAISNQFSFMYDVESNNGSIQGCCGDIQATKKGKLCCNVKQVNR